MSKTTLPLKVSEPMASMQAAAAKLHQERNLGVDLTAATGGPSSRPSMLRARSVGANVRVTTAIGWAKHWGVKIVAYAQGKDRVEIDLTKIDHASFAQIKEAYSAIGLRLCLDVEAL